MGKARIANRQSKKFSVKYKALEPGDFFIDIDGDFCMKVTQTLFYDFTTQNSYDYSVDYFDGREVTLTGDVEIVWSE